MFHRTITRLSLSLAAGLAVTACAADDLSEPVDEQLETQLSELEAESAAAAMRRHGLPGDAGEGAPEGERPPRGERPERPEGAEGEGPEPGVDPAAWCAEHLDALIERCEARAAEAEALPEDFPGCEVVAEERCLERAAHAIRRRVAACHADCRPEARAVFGLCAEGGDAPEVCRAEAMEAAEACHEACPDAPPRPEREDGAERPQRPAPEDGAEGQRPQRPAPEDGAEGQRPQRPAPEDGAEGQRPQRPAPEDGAEGQRPQRPAPEDGAERPERPAPEDGAEGQRPQRPAPEDGAEGQRPQRPAPEDGAEGERPQRPAPDGEGEEEGEGEG